MTKKWLVPESVDSKVSNRWMKKRVQSVTWIRLGLEGPTDDVHPDETNVDESKYERAFVNESLPELIETKQRLFWNTCWLSYVMSPALFLRVRTCT